MVTRVALIGTGNAGRKALRHLWGDERFELTGVWVSSPEKVGRDAGEFAGMDVETGIIATGDLEEIIAAKPDCVMYCAMADNRAAEAVQDCIRILSAGINIVGTSPTTLIYPWGVMPQKYLDLVEQAAVDSGASIYVTGIDPGFANDVIPLVMASTCRRVDQVRCLEIADYASYDGATVMHDVMGFGRPLDSTPILLRPGVLSASWGPTLRLLADGLGFELESVTESVEREPAPEDFEVAVGTIRKGTMAALRFLVNGIVDGKEVLTIEHVTRLREDLRPDWAQPSQPGGCYRVEITGEPSYVVDILPTSAEGDHNYAAILACVGRAVNAIEQVVAAAPGIRTMLDLPLVGSAPKPSRG